LGTSGNIKIDGNDLESFSANGFVSTRLGTHDQEALPGSSEITLDQNVGQMLAYGHGITATTQNDVDGFGIVLEFPNGYFGRKRDGSYFPSDLVFEIRYRVNELTGGPYTGYAYVHEKFEFHGPGTALFRIDFPTTKEGDKYRGEVIDVELTRLDEPHAGQSPQKIEWKYLREYSDDQAQIYPYTALLHVDADAASASGPIGNITSRIQGKKVWTYSGGAWAYSYSTNPAWCCLDLLLNERYGGGSRRRLTLANIDLDSFEDWADYCDERITDPTGGTMPRWEIGLVIDKERTLWEWATTIAAAGRAKLIWTGNKLRAKAEKEVTDSDIKQVFSAGNIVAGSFSLQYIGKESLPDAIDLKFWDADLDFAENIATADEPSLKSDDGSSIKETLDFKGCTSYHRAKRQARFLLNTILYEDFVCEWEAFIDAVACEPGDVVVVSNDCIDWEAVGGRLKENAPGANSIKLDRDITVDASRTYKISVRSEYSSDDYHQSRTVDETDTTITAGNTVDITPAWTTVPQAGDVYSFMPIVETQDVAEGAGAKLVRIVSMDVTDEYFVKIKAVKYDARIYNDDPGKAKQPPVLPTRDGNVIPPPVEKLGLSNEYYGSGRKQRVVATWQKSDWPWPYACKVFGRVVEDDRFNDRFQLIAVASSNFAIFNEVEEDFTYEVAVVPCAPWNWNTHHNPGSKYAKRKRITLTRPIDPARIILPTING
jgi:hypothetical protein